MRIVLAASAFVVASAPGGAFAAEYMTADAAARLMFPDADSFDVRSVTLDAAQFAQLDAQGVRGRSANWQVKVARHAGATLGYVVTDEVIGKVELINYAVGLSVDGAVKQVEILAYRESHGFEIRLPAWRKQFVGKTAASPLRLGDDIANISGATLSCTHVTEGVRRIVAVVALARQGGALHE
jgi:Na+-translocating ferredoxin:NAD+ oxidoreductase RnfG subunit